MPFKIDPRAQLAFWLGAVVAPVVDGLRANDEPVEIRAGDLYSLKQAFEDYLASYEPVPESPDLSADQLAEKVRGWRDLAFVAIRDGENWNDRRLPEIGRAMNDALDALLACLAEAKDTLAACQASAAVLAEGSLDQRSRTERAEKRLAEAEKERDEAIEVLAESDLVSVSMERDRLKANALLAGSHLDWLIGYLDIDAADDWLIAAREKAKAARTALSGGGET